MQLGLHVSYLFQLNVCAFLVKVVNCKCYENANFYVMHFSVCCRPTFLGEAEACCAGMDAPAACFGEDTAALDLESTCSV